MFLWRSTAFLDYGFTPYTALLYLRTEEKVRTSCVPIVSAFTNSLFHQVSFFYYYYYCYFLPTFSGLIRELLLQMLPKNHHCAAVLPRILSVGVV